MGIMRRTNQGGSAITFIIVGIILAIGLISTIYFVKQRGEVVRKEQAIAAYDKEQAAKKATEDSNGSNVVNSGDSETSNENKIETVQDLPVTGPEFIYNEMLGVSAMTIAIASYLSSRRNLTRSL